LQSTKSTWSTKASLGPQPRHEVTLGAVPVSSRGGMIGLHSTVRVHENCAWQEPSSTPSSLSHTGLTLSTATTRKSAPSTYPGSKQRTERHGPGYVLLSANINRVERMSTAAGRGPGVMERSTNHMWAASCQGGGSDVFNATCFSTYNQATREVLLHLFI
jgi:hypothetical protein